MSMKIMAYYNIPFFNMWLKHYRFWQSIFYLTLEFQMLFLIYTLSISHYNCQDLLRLLIAHSLKTTPFIPQVMGISQYC